MLNGLPLNIEVTDDAQPYNLHDFARFWAKCREFRTLIEIPTPPTRILPSPIESQFVKKMSNNF